MALTDLQLDFLSPRVDWAYAGDVYGGWDARMVPYGVRPRAALVDIFSGRPLSPRLVGPLDTAALTWARFLPELQASSVVFGPLLLKMSPAAN
jgi:hypothetical protein